MMKRIFTTAILVTFSLMISLSQESGKQWLNINYGGNDKEYHNLDIYLPNTDKPSYKAIVIIYGSAWFGNNMKQFIIINFI